MKRIAWSLGIVALVTVATAIAQPPEGRGGPQGRPRGGFGGGRPPMPIIDALDTNRDHVISADEINAASAALLTLDRNRDGKLTENEYGPDGGGRGGPGGPGGPPQRGRAPAGRDDGPPPPDPERMVDHALEFDADEDGKLSREELSKFAEDFAAHRPGPGGPPRDGDGPERGGRGPKNENGVPERPRRPD